MDTIEGATWKRHFTDTFGSWQEEVIRVITLRSGSKNSQQGRLRLTTRRHAHGQEITLSKSFKERMQASLGNGKVFDRRPAPRESGFDAQALELYIPRCLLNIIRVSNQ